MPAASTLNLPYVPATSLCTTTVAAVASRSVSTSWPPVLSTASPSVRVLLSLLSCATSSLPVMITVTLALPPSLVATSKVSVTR
ncbi:hypothetical protein D3C80_1943600 [compost metagenome]